MFSSLSLLDLSSAISMHLRRQETCLMLHLPDMMDQIPWTTSQSIPFLPHVASAKCFVTAMRKVMHITGHHCLPRFYQEEVTIITTCHTLLIWGEKPGRGHQSPVSISTDSRAQTSDVGHRRAHPPFHVWQQEKKNTENSWTKTPHWSLSWSPFQLPGENALRRAT